MKIGEYNDSLPKGLSNCSLESQNSASNCFQSPESLSKVSITDDRYRMHAQKLSLKPERQKFQTAFLSRRRSARTALF